MRIVTSWESEKIAEMRWPKDISISHPMRVAAAKTAERPQFPAEGARGYRL